MYYDYEQEQIRKQLKQRYNRKFFLGAHITILIMALLLASAIPSLQILVVVISVALIPHMIYVAYFEYHRWLEKKIDRELHRNQQMSYVPDKRKRYQHEPAGQPTFRLTDDGEIEQVPHEVDAHYQHQSTTHDAYTDSKKKAYKEKKRKDDSKYRKREKKRRKFDTDEFDVKKLLKKIKDIVD